MGEEATAAVAVRGAGPEDADASPRPTLLRSLAEATGGGFASASDGGMPRLALNDPEKVEVGRRRAVSVWDRWWTLCALAAVLAFEWVLRRRWGYF
jgi:hypothetical protein